MTTNEELMAAIVEMKTIMLARMEGAIAPDLDVMGKYGDPKVRFNPATYRGASCKGMPMSRCSPEFLDHYAHALTEMANKDDRAGKMYNGEPASRNGRTDAARARRWALKKRLGWTPPERTGIAAATPIGGGIAPASPMGAATRTPIGLPKPAPIATGLGASRTATAAAATDIWSEPEGDSELNDELTDDDNLLGDDDDGPL